MYPGISVDSDSVCLGLQQVLRNVRKNERKQIQ